MAEAKIVRFPRLQRLAKSYLEEQLPYHGKDLKVVTKNPRNIPDHWIRLQGQGGAPKLHEWPAMLNIYVYGKAEDVVEENGNLVHSLMLAAAGVGIVVPEYNGAYPWVRMTRHISGPTALDPDEDLPNLDIARIVVTWHVLPIP